MKFKFLSSITFIIISFFVFINLAQAQYPKLANYFLKWDINSYEAEKLAQWDLLILDMELSINSPDKLREIRQHNPDVIILAYITSQEIINNAYSYPNAILRQKLYRNIDDSWWLKNTKGENIVYWPNTRMLNVSDGADFNQYLPQFVFENIYSSGLWDGVFYDNTWGDVSWVDDSIDIKNNQQEYSNFEIDNYWSQGFKNILETTRQLTGDDFIIVGNGRIHYPYLPYLHGMMFEGFPSYWESGGTWQGSVNTYLDIASETRQPHYSVINSHNKDQKDYQTFRFGLGSALLGQAYYSFDYDVTCHTQLWWYDEYDTYLGQAINSPYNLLDENNNQIKPGLWRRDFQNGTVIVNSTDRKQRYIFDREVFEKISGSQDKQVNSGERINWLEIDSQDAIILLREMSIIYDSSFTNGQFFRVFNENGQSARTGFFSYLNNYPGSSQVLLYDLDGDGIREHIVSYNGQVKVYKNGQEILGFQPFAKGFYGKISLAVADLNSNGQKEIVVGAGPGGGPQVRVYNLNGDCVSTFFAYDSEFRGGIDLTVGDTNGNGKYEIITGAGPGGGPHIRIFDYTGRELSTFFAFNQDFRGGVNVTSADLDANNKDQIIAGSGPGINAQVAIFNQFGEKTSSFIPIEDYRQGITMSAFDSSGDGKAEIFVGFFQY